MRTLDDLMNNIPQTGKVEWIAHHLNTRDFFLGANKEFAAGPDKYLVDDYDKNLDKFAKAGGVAVRFKAPWDESSEGMQWYEVVALLKNFKKTA